MNEPPLTRASLLLRLRNARDGEAWAQFLELYAPVIYGFARKQGLQDADAADLTQDVLRAVSGAFGKLSYDANRGSFRGWLFTIVRNKLKNFRLSQSRRCQASGDESMQAILDVQAAPVDDVAAIWDREYEQQMFHWAAEQVRGEFQTRTWDAFWSTAVDGRSIADTAADLGISNGAVYIARSRVLARLRDCIRKVEDD